MKPYFALFLCVALASCASHMEITYDTDLRDVPQIQVLSEEAVLDKELLMPKEIFVLGDALVVYDSSSPDGILHFFGKDGRYITSFGKIGNAGKEFLQPYVYQDAEKLLLVSVKGTYAEITYRDSLNVIYGAVEDKSVKEGINYLASTSDGMIVSSNASKDRLTFLKAGGRPVAYNDYPVKMPADVDPYFYKSVIWDSTYSCSFNGCYLFAAQRNYPVVEIIDVRTRKEKAVGIKTQFKNEYAIRKGIPEYDNVIICYTKSRASQSYFYSLYHGVEKKHIVTNCPEIHRYDRDCNLSGRIKLAPGTYSFAVDASDNIVYALAMRQDGTVNFNKYIIRE